MPDSNNAPGAELPGQLIDKKALRKMVPVADMTIWRWEHATDENGRPKFPKRIRLGPGRVAWKLSEVLAWIEAKVVETDGETQRPPAGIGPNGAPDAMAIEGAPVEVA